MGSISIPTALAVASLATAAVGTVVAVSSAEQAASAQSAAAKYNAQVAANNATIANQNSQWAVQAGEAKVEQQGLKNRAVAGAIKANEAASNVDVNSGSAVDVQSSAAELGELDAINIRSDAARTAYGYEAQGTSFTAQSQLDEFTASNDLTAGNYAAASSFLGGASTGTANYLKFQQSGAL